MSRDQRNGFSFIELLVVIVVMGILASVAMQSMTATIADVRRVKTERELEMLARAIVGDPALIQNGARSDFGYFGDVGAFPPSLQALYQNPGGYSTWDGPYVPVTFYQDSTDFKVDEWGAPYSYSGGIALSSTGGNTIITRKVADATTDYLLNRVAGEISDARGTSPGMIYADSVDIAVTFPNGTGATSTKTYHPDASGQFTLDSIPAGRHSLRFVYTPEHDTLQRYLTVLPRHRSAVSFQFASVFTGGGTPATETLTLRPSGAGALTNLTSSGCSSNYECVLEATPDGDVSVVIRASSTFATDVYTLDDPVGGSGTIHSVTVYCQARKVQTLGEVQLVLYSNGVEYRGGTQSLTISYATYSESWASDPSGGAWTWADLTNLQAGVRLSGQNSNFPGYGTQVWVEVVYEN